METIYGGVDLVRRSFKGSMPLHGGHTQESVTREMGRRASGEAIGDYSGQWLYPNVEVHDAIAGELATTRKEEIRQELEEQIAMGGEGLEEEDQYLLEINLDDIETSSGED